MVIPTKLTTIDRAGRLVIPKPFRDRLGLVAGTRVEVRVVDDRLELAVPSRVRLEEGPHGARFASEADERLSTEEVRELMERGRR